MKNTRINNTEAVSPVIGVIADMVGVRVITLPHYDGGETYGRDKSLVLNYWFASTVILAAVIAAFVFGMAGQIQTTKVVAVTAAQPDATHIIATYQGGQDAGTLYAIRASLVTAEATPVTYMGERNGASVVVKGVTPGVAFTDAGTVAVPVGTSIPFAATGGGTFSGRDHLTVTGVFGDGTESVILDTFI
jgi:hypothetical protein